MTSFTRLRSVFTPSLSVASHKAMVVDIGSGFSSAPERYGVSSLVLTSVSIRRDILTSRELDLVETRYSVRIKPNVVECKE